MKKYFQILKKIGSAFRTEPQSARSILRALPATARGFAFARNWQNGSSPARSEPSTATVSPASDKNALRDYFDAHHTGRGIWKWEHYFDVYHRHCQKFVGKEVAVLEIGIYSGGSLDMWRTYFGPSCRIYGVDIESACKAYENDGVKVFIGDQADRAFWRRLKREVPVVDLVIDDGGHAPEQQIVTLEETLPLLRPGGVYICEDIHGIHHEFAAYVHGLVSQLHSMKQKEGKVLASTPTSFQREIASIHLYPYLVVIEKAPELINQFVCPHHGTEWQPFAVHSFREGQKADPAVS